ncbi:hypothetical protein L6232_25040 [Shewanella sp. C31]|nr:hypothetical protein [Shewanella electrica]
MEAEEGAEAVARARAALVAALDRG